MRVMGLDISTKPGIAVLEVTEGPRPAILTAFEGSYPSGLTGMRRAGAIAKIIIDTLKEYQPDVVFMEDYGFAFKGAAIVVIEITAVVKYFLCQEGYDEFCVVAPNSIKQFLTGKGNADKAQMVKEVYKKLGFDAESDNVADAIAVAMFGLAVKGELTGISKACMTPVEKYLTPVSTKKKASSMPNVT